MNHPVSANPEYPFKTRGKVFIRTFGCQMNVYDSEKILAFLHNRYQLVEKVEDADLIILNTCSVREKARQKVFSYIGRLKSLKRENPDLLIAVGGCVAQQDGEEILRNVPDVDVVFGTHNIDELPDILDERFKSGGRVCRLREDSDEVSSSRTPFRSSAKGPNAAITIMKGCNNYCAYCIVPMVRGREISRRVQDIVDEAVNLVANGAREITLLGQNVNSYRDPVDGRSFVNLLEVVGPLDGLSRLRFTTSHPKDFSKDLAHAIHDLPAVCEHVHLPIQAASNRVLKAMNRGYTREEYLEKIHYLRRLIGDVEITADIIVGFPGEERRDFEETLAFIREIQYLNIFSFRFSSRPGTAAADIDDPVPNEEKRGWLPELQALQNEITGRKHERMVGETVTVLVEGKGLKGNGILEGRTRNNYIVHFPGSSELTGQMVQVRVKRSKKIHLEGEIYHG